MKYTYLILCFVLCILSCKSPEARPPVTVQTGTFLKESAKRNKILNEQESKVIKALIKKDSTKSYITSNSGFWYHYNEKLEKDTLKPIFGDIVNFSYKVSKLNGEEIYKTQQKTYVIDQQELFSGLREGLKLMKPTERVTFIFPSQIAYDYYGDSKKIGTNVPLIYEVKLNTITKEND